MTSHIRPARLREMCWLLCMDALRPPNHVHDPSGVADFQRVKSALVRCNLATVAHRTEASIYRGERNNDRLYGLALTPKGLAWAARAEREAGER